MSLQIFTRAKCCISSQQLTVGHFLLDTCRFAGSFFLALACGVLMIQGVARADWKIDFSKRMQDQRKSEMHEDTPEGKPKDSTIFEWLASSVADSDRTQEMVILNTDGGFIPNTLRVREGGSYKIYVVNVNEKEKNVSFVMDSFSEHHATFFGKIKSFTIQPKKEGVYSFVCPETGTQGRLVVHPGAEPSLRAPASESLSARPPMEP